MLNQIVLMGRLTKDPEVRKVGEKQVSKGRFTLAVDRPRYGDTQPQADFIPRSYRFLRLFAVLQNYNIPLLPYLYPHTQ